MFLTAPGVRQNGLGVKRADRVFPGIGRPGTPPLPPGLLRTLRRSCPAAPAGRFLSASLTVGGTCGFLGVSVQT
jgi:hypothetical protein